MTSATKQTFDVVLQSRAPGLATVASFKRVRVEAESTLSARLDDAVMKAMEEAPGWNFLYCARPGELGDPELQARARAAAPAHRFDPKTVKFA